MIDLADTAIVYVSDRCFMLNRPGVGRYHELDPRRSEWPVYVHDEEISARVGYPASRRTGREVQRTRCGRLIYRSRDGEEYGVVRQMTGLRHDVARLFTVPCSQCFR